MVKQKDIPSPAKKRELILQALYQKEISGVSKSKMPKYLLCEDITAPVLSNCTKPLIEKIFFMF